jgi:hypothetical protein
MKPNLEARVERLEQRKAAATERLLAQLSDEELEALAGPGWSDLTDAEIEAVAHGTRTAPRAVLEYEPPMCVIDRLQELATPAEARLLGLA